MDAATSHIEAKIDHTETMSAHKEDEKFYIENAQHEQRLQQPT